MKKYLAVALFGFAIAFNSFPAPTSVEQLRSELETALKAGDTNAVISLINWDGVPNESKKAIQGEIQWMCGEDVTNVSISPVDCPLEFEYGGFHYRPNVSVVGTMHVNFKPVGNTNTAVTSETEPNFGKTNDSFYIAGSVKEKVTKPGPRQKTLNITLNTLDSKSNVFMGFFSASGIYVSYGTDVTYHFNGNGSGNILLTGEYVKSCTAKNFSGKGVIGLEIKEDDKEIFDFKTNTSIFYERK